VQVSESDVTVSIGGESGTGKELLARAIHNLSARRDAPFIPVNCGAIAEGVLESELFGHEKGAYTGAVSQRKGVFEQADSGTIFLDEIGEIKPDVQVKLLRVLEQRSFARVGGTEQIEVNVRVLAASNRDLRTLMDEGMFRDDLYYRLSVVSLVSPPLRSRKPDIVPIMLAMFWKIHRREVEIDPEAVELLLRYSWPGNVRELRNFVDVTTATSDSGRITQDLVGDYVSAQSQHNRRLPVATGHSHREADFRLMYQALLNLAQEVKGMKDIMIERLGSTHDHPDEYVGPVDRSVRDSGDLTGIVHVDSNGDSLSIDDMESVLIRKALARVNGNRRKAAELLGIGQRTLYRKLKEYNIQ